MDEAHFMRWLDAYKAAWEGGDPEAAAALFTAAATYHETPFAEPLRGRAAIRAYRAQGARDAQRDVAFGYEIWAVIGDVGLCRWRCRFTRRATGGRVELDGVFRCTFEAEGHEAGLCRCFQEWWHRRSAPAL